ncbi:hypothetical protein CK203_020025 [Vitis vinifera]|uniref:Uncharacterized protein n=1 Tax=Vitis vinifera TaxID=29760 RepID=A0A438J2V6_VITVI|nr:hypothetical protein CK203_020025 [Vitis vinifera]
MDPPQEDQNSQQGQGDQWVEETNLKLFCKRNEKFMNVGKGIWRPSMLVLIMALIHGSCYVSEVTRGWNEPNSRNWKDESSCKSKGGMYMLSEDMDMKAKVATIARRLEELELKKMHEVQAISETQAHAMPCTICHHVIMWPNNNAPYGNTYNSSWRNHPNFSWKPRPPPYQPQAQLKHLNKPLQWSKPCEPKGGFFKVEGGQSCDHLEDRKEVDQPLPKVRQDEESCQRKPWLKRAMTKKRRVGRKVHPNQALEEEPRIVIKEDMMKNICLPLSSSFTWKEGNQEFIRILEVLRQVKVNIPLLDMIKQVPICKVSKRTCARLREGYM